jgi:hypothetical protein
VALEVIASDRPPVRRASRFSLGRP